MRNRITECSELLDWSVASADSNTSFSLQFREPQQRRTMSLRPTTRSSAPRIITSTWEEKGPLYRLMCSVEEQRSSQIIILKSFGASADVAYICKEARFDRT